VNRLAELCCPKPPEHALVPPRGPARQRLRRERERNLRRNVVDLADCIIERGQSPTATAEHLRLSPRTLRQWRHDAHADNLRLRILGRPTLRAPRQQRTAVIDLLNQLGPTIGVPTLRDCFPHLPRAELTDLLKRYRRVWRSRYYQLLHVLHWQRCGAVWAMDFAQPPKPIDGNYPYLLGVRDLASGQQLLWLPIAHANTDEAILALAPLFVIHAPPLVLKTDNGSPFCAEAMLNYLLRFDVLPLFSPPYWPRYNGAVEAGIGSLKTRTEDQAKRHGRPACWTCDDVEAARLEANATARPKGPEGPTPDQLWDARVLLNAEERTLFADALTQQRITARIDLALPIEGELATLDVREVDRQAIRRALVEHDYLLFSRRRIPLPFTQPKTAEIC
jgi:transposase InsO family protein